MTVITVLVPLINLNRGTNCVQNYLNYHCYYQLLSFVSKFRDYMGNTNNSEEPGSMGTMDAESLVSDAVKTHPVVIFSKSYCPYCISAKRHISQAGKSVAGFTAPKVYELDHMGSLGQKVQSYLAERTGRRTVPNVFIGGVPVGGGNEVGSYSQRGILKQMLTQAPSRLASSSSSNSSGPISATDATTTDQNVVNGDAKPDDDENSNDVAYFVDTKVKSSPVVIFSKTYCPYCTRAKALLRDAGSQFDNYVEADVHELDAMGDRGAAIQDHLMEQTGQRTVPNIFIGGKHVGGCDSVQSMAQAGELDGALHEAYLSATGSKTESADDVNVKEIVFGAGCFWGVELAFQRVVGVMSTEVGYSNGKFSPVTYDAVCSGHTGAAEVVRVKYDENTVSLRELLDVWASRHDPTSLNKQGNDVGTQYRSAIYYFDDAQADMVRHWMDGAKQQFSGDLVTDVAVVNNYCPAEQYHQRYLEKKGQSAAKGDTKRIRCYG